MIIMVKNSSLFEAVTSVTYCMKNIQVFERLNILNIHHNQMKFYICFQNTPNIAKIYIFSLYVAYFSSEKKLLGVLTENLTIKY